MFCIAQEYTGNTHIAYICIGLKKCSGTRTLVGLETVERLLPHSVNSAFVMNTSTSNVDDGTKLMVIRKCDSMGLEMLSNDITF